MFNRLFMTLALVLSITACSTGVKLDDVPVEDRNPSGVSSGAPAPGGASTAGSTLSRVAPVAAETGGNTAAGPVNVGRLAYFDYDSNAIKPEFQALIESHARFLKANNSRRIAVEGHTDERGGREYNLALGQRRAEAVRRALGLLGVADNQVEAVSFGKEKPADAASNESAWAKNRRAEIVYR